MDWTVATVAEHPRHLVVEPGMAGVHSWIGIDERDRVAGICELRCHVAADTARAGDDDLHQ